MLAADTKYGRFAARVLGATISYAATFVPSATADIEAIDEGMRLGYNWRWGPFELADMIGVAKLIALLSYIARVLTSLLTSICSPEVLRELTKGDWI